MMAAKQQDQPGQVFHDLKFITRLFFFAGIPDPQKTVCRFFWPGFSGIKTDEGKGTVLEQRGKIFLPENAVETTAHKAGMKDDGTESADFITMPKAGVQHFAVNKEAFAFLQNQLFSADTGSALSFFHHQRFQLFMPVPGNRRLPEIVVITGHWKKR